MLNQIKQCNQHAVKAGLAEKLDMQILMYWMAHHFCNLTLPTLPQDLETILAPTRRRTLESTLGLRTGPGTTPLPLTIPPGIPTTTISSRPRRITTVPAAVTEVIALAARVDIQGLKKE